VLVPDYPLAPAVTAKASFAMVEQVYKDLLTKVSAEKVIFMGASAGAGFALALAQKLKKEGLLQSEQVILLSPWLDTTMNNLDAVEAEKEDPWLSIEGLRGAGKLWAGELDGKDPLLSPIYRSVAGLVWCGRYSCTHWACPGNDEPTTEVPDTLPGRQRAFSGRASRNMGEDSSLCITRENEKMMG
jgi:acetyl esterase/lipase